MISGFEIANIFDGDLTTYWNPDFGGRTYWTFIMKGFKEGTGDSMLVLDTCGSDRVVPGFETPAAVLDDSLLTSFSQARCVYRFSLMLFKFLQFSRFPSFRKNLDFVFSKPWNRRRCCHGCSSCCRGCHCRHGVFTN